MTRPPGPALRRTDYTVEPVDLYTCQDLVRRLHYAGGGPNTGVARHGLFHRDDPMTCLGVAWWLPPTKAAGLATWPSNPHAVLSLTRLAIEPEVPTNAASFLLSRSVKLLRADPRWECLVTYADEGQGHTGTIYRAAGWEYVGPTSTEAVWKDARGRQVSRKAGPVSRTVEQMRDLGYVNTGRTSKHKFRLALTAPAVDPA